MAQGLIDALVEVQQTGEPYIAYEAPTELYDDHDDVARLRYLTYIYQPIKDCHDHVTGVLCIGYDVTEQRVARSEAERLRDELGEASRVAAMGTMATILAHELNQPLTSLVMYAEGLLRHRSSMANTEVADVLRSIESQALQASEIMRRMRTIGSGQQTRQDSLDLRPVIAGALRTPLVACDGVEVDLEIDHSGLACGDALQVQQVIINIVRNACEAMDGLGDKMVRIETRDHTNGILISISDSGPGVTPDLLPKLFEAMLSTKQGGMGIGLAICRTIVEAHGGRMGAYNHNGGGATFWLTLPRQK